MKQRSTSELLSPFSVAFWMGGGLVVLLLLTSKKKTPINTVQGLPPYQGPRVAGPASDAIVGAKKPRTNEDIAKHWERMAADCEADAKNPRYRKERALNLELAAKYRKKAANERSGRGMWDFED